MRASVCLIFVLREKITARRCAMPSAARATTMPHCCVVCASGYPGGTELVPNDVNVCRRCVRRASREKPVSKLVEPTTESDGAIAWLSLAPVDFWFWFFVALPIETFEELVARDIPRPIQDSEIQDLWGYTWMWPSRIGSEPHINRHVVCVSMNLPGCYHPLAHS